jgi:hypothetical protein
MVQRAAVELLILMVTLYDHVLGFANEPPGRIDVDLVPHA